jgi:hypothetical protein
MDPVKTEAVKTWPVPTNKRELQQFLGFCNYYRKFIEGFSKLSNPLQLLVGKNDWNWTDLQQNAFEGLRSKLSNGPMLALPNNCYEKTFLFHFSLSHHAIILSYLLLSYLVTVTVTGHTNPRTYHVISHLISHVLDCALLRT